MTKLLGYIILIFFMMSCEKYSPCERFYIPRDYIGEIKIYYNRADGQNKLDKDNCKEYYVSKNGECYSRWAYEKNGTIVEPGKTYKYYLFDSAKQIDEVYEFNVTDYLKNVEVNKGKRYVGYFWGGLMNDKYVWGFTIDTGASFYEQIQNKQ